MFNVKKYYRTVGLFGSLLVCGFSSAVNADQKPSIYYTPSGSVGNYWMVTFFDDTSAAHNQWATQGLCFSPAVPRGTGWEGRVVSLTFPNWSGVYYTDAGDVYELKMNYAPVAGGYFAGNDFISFSLHSANRGAGERGWDEWRDGLPSSWNVWGNTEINRVGKCKQFSSSTKVVEFERVILEIQGKIEPRMTRKGELAGTPIASFQDDPREVLPVPDGVAYGLK